MLRRCYNWQSPPLYINNIHRIYLSFAKQCFNLFTGINLKCKKKVAENITIGLLTATVFHYYREETLENGLFCVLVFGALNNDLLHCKEIDINTKTVNRWYLTLTGPFASRVGLGKSARLGLRFALSLSKYPSFLWWINDKIFSSSFKHGRRGLANEISTSRRSQYINCLFPAFLQQNNLHISSKNLYLHELSNVTCTRSVIPARSAIIFSRVRTIYWGSSL